MGKIIIEELEIYAFHGYYDEEQKIGGNYLVDIEIETNTSVAEKADDLKGTINYAEIVQIVIKEMQIKSRLIEHVAGRIIDRIMGEYKEIDSVKIRVSKMNPPVGMKLKSVCIELERNRK